MAENIIYQGLSKCNEFWGTEVGLYFPKIYAGTTDLVGVHDGAEAIMDHKQSNKLKKREWIEDYFLQLAAYANAHNHTHGTDICDGVILMCTKPGDDETEPQYQEFELDQFSRQLYSTPNSRVENDQSAYSHFLYGDMPSAKESTPEGNMQRIKDNYRYTLY